jgi:hypothetical protein
MHDAWPPPHSLVATKGTRVKTFLHTNNLYDPLSWNLFDVQPIFELILDPISALAVAGEVRRPATDIRTTYRR